MFLLIVKGPRRATLAVHRCDSNADLQELLEVYHALGYDAEALIIEDRSGEKAA